ncbi:hypothetical protein LAN14_26110, partial [Mycobacterium tuberculosis]|nr:hypothetical protein [Mycobacterium tuberculosis]
LCEQLHQLGWLTLETASGEEALQLLEASPDIALLISDLMLPGALSGAITALIGDGHPPASPPLGRVVSCPGGRCPPRPSPQ